MGQVLEAIIKKKLFNNEIINTSVISDQIDIDNRESAFSIQIDYSDGVGPVDVTFTYELSSGTTFVPVTSEEVNITDESGSILFDIADTGASLLRLNVTVVSGSLNVTASYSAKRRH